MLEYNIKIIIIVQGGSTENDQTARFYLWRVHIPQHLKIIMKVLQADIHFSSVFIKKCRGYTSGNPAGYSIGPLPSIHMNLFTVIDVQVFWEFTTTLKIISLQLSLFFF